MSAQYAWVAGLTVLLVGFAFWPLFSRQRRRKAVELRAVIHAIRNRYPLVRERLLTVFPNAAVLPQPARRHICRSDEFSAAVKALADADAVQSTAVEAAWEPLTKALLEAAKAPIGRTKPAPATPH